MWLRQSALLTWPLCGAATGPICLSDTGECVRARPCVFACCVRLVRRSSRWIIWAEKLLIDPFISALLSFLLGLLLTLHALYPCSLQLSTAVGLPVWDEWASVLVRECVWVCAFSLLCCCACVNYAHTDIVQIHTNSQQIEALLKWNGRKLRKRE